MIIFVVIAGLLIGVLLQKGSLKDSHSLTTSSEITPSSRDSTYTQLSDTGNITGFIPSAPIVPTSTPAIQLTPTPAALINPKFKSEGEKTIEDGITAKLGSYNPDSISVAPDLITLDFSDCQKTRVSVAVAFGSTTYEIDGKTGDKCLMDYGGEVKNPNWDGKLSYSCQIPQGFGKKSFSKTNFGIDFSPLQEYCTNK